MQAGPVPPVPAAPVTSGAAIGAFILALVSWVVIPVIPAIVALAIAPQADREVAAGKAGSGLTTAARIISWINIGLWAAVIVLLGGFMLFALVAGSGR